MLPLRVFQNDDGTLYVVARGENYAVEIPPELAESVAEAAKAKAVESFCSRRFTASPEVRKRYGFAIGNMITAVKRIVGA
jgi:hypothetical protein